MLEAHLADLTTALALNTMALSAFGLTGPVLDPPAVECQC
jgi:hypothetical protein